MSSTVSSALILTMGPKLCSYGLNVSFEPSITLKMLAATSTSQSVFCYLHIPASTSMEFIVVCCWYTPSLPATTVSPSRIRRDHNFRSLANVGL
jgi:hypothetical protein